MQRKSISMIAAPIIMVCGLLFAGSRARANDEDTKCTNRTLRGDYGFVAQGVLIGIPGFPPEAQFRSVGVAHFDGKGNLTWQEHTVENGKPLNADWVQASGTYTVNSNCTGTAVVNTPNSPFPLTLVLVAVKEGKQIETILDSNAITSVFIKVE
jgi:hypothetical protein